MIRRLWRQTPKWAFVVTVLVVSTALFAFWWVTRKKPHSPQQRAQIAADNSAMLAKLESRIDRLLLVDNDLYDVETGELYLKSWLKEGVPARLFFDRESKKLIGQVPNGFVRIGLDGITEAMMLEKFPVVVSDKREWIVFARDKDLWRADVDWKEFRFTGERKLTGISQFFEQHFAGNIVMASDRTLLVRNMNVVLRVNLETGDVKPVRLPLMKQKAKSPDGQRFIAQDGRQLFCYELDSDEAKPIEPGRAPLGDLHWLGNDRCALLLGSRTLAVYDRLASKLEAVTDLPMDCTQLADPSPNGRFLFAGSPRGGLLVDLREKKVAPIIGGVGFGWVSDESFLCSRDVPDSSLRGSWIQNGHEPERRISPEPYLVPRAGEASLTFKSAGMVLLLSKGGIAAVSSDGTNWKEVITLAALPDRMNRIDPLKRGVLK
jgi:hypothetical protein